MDHTHLTTKGVNRRSSQIQIMEAIEQCRLSAMKEFRATSFIGNWRPKSLHEAIHIATGLAIEDARRQCGGDKVPNWTWDNQYIPEVYQKQHKIPFHFLHDIQMRPLIEKAQEEGRCQLSGGEELIKKVLGEEAEEAAEVGAEGDPELANLEKILAEAEGQVVPGSAPDIVVVDPTKNPDGSMSPREKIRLGLRDRQYGGEPPPEDRREARKQALLEKAPEDRTPAENIELGTAEAEWRRGKNPKNK